MLNNNNHHPINTVSKRATSLSRLSPPLSACRLGKACPAQDRGLGNLLHHHHSTFPSSLPIKAPSTSHPPRHSLLRPPQPTTTILYLRVAWKVSRSMTWNGINTRPTGQHRRTPTGTFVSCNKRFPFKAPDRLATCRCLHPTLQCLRRPAHRQQESRGVDGHHLRPAQQVKSMTRSSPSSTVSQRPPSRLPRPKCGRTPSGSK